MSSVCRCYSTTRRRTSPAIINISTVTTKACKTTQPSPIKTHQPRRFPPPPKLSSDNSDLLPFDPPPRPPKPPTGHHPSIQAELAAEIAASAAAERHGPIPLRIRKPFPVNQDWAVLDVFYANLFGFKEYVERGYLTKELAWQAVTYKSFNHGVDAYNEKLAHLGTEQPTPPPRHLLSLFCLSVFSCGFGREADSWVGKRVIRMVVAQHALDFPAETEKLNNLNVNALSKSLMANIVDLTLIGDMGLRYGVGEVMRWKPAFVPTPKIPKIPKTPQNKRTQFQSWLTVGE
jgi:hypothetical protein